MNLIRKRTTTVAIAVLATAAGLTACKGKDQYASADTSAARTDSAGGAMSAPAMAARTDSVVPTPAAAWSDAAILGFALVADKGELVMGELGETKATNSAVKAFARKMVADHKAMLSGDQALSTKLSVSGDTTADDARALIGHGRDELKELGDKTAGTDWDKNYMDKMVSDHQSVLDKLQEAAKKTTNTELRAALEKTTGRVQQHLTKAKDIVANSLKA